MVKEKITQAHTRTSTGYIIQFSKDVQSKNKLHRVITIPKKEEDSVKTPAGPEILHFKFTHP